MTQDEAIALLVACKPLAVKLKELSPEGAPVKYTVTQEDLLNLQGFVRVQNDPITAGPGLLGRLLKAADLNQVEVYKLDQLSRLVSSSRYKGKVADTRYK